MSEPMNDQNAITFSLAKDRFIHDEFGGLHIEDIVSMSLFGGTINSSQL